MTDGQATVVALLLAILGLIGMAWFNPARGESVTPLVALQMAQEDDLLPAWVDWRDSYRLVRSGRLVGLCIEDRGSPATFMVQADLKYLTRWLNTGQVEYDPAIPTRPLTPAELALCWS